MTSAHVKPAPSLGDRPPSGGGRSCDDRLEAPTEARRLFLGRRRDDRVDRDLLKQAAEAEVVELASESEFRDLFSNCQLGAMPPFGNLWDMKVFVDERLAEDEEIAFNAGSHSELVRLAYADFERLVQPKVVHLTTRENVLTG